MKSTDRDQQAAAFAARKKAILAAMPHVLLAISLLITVAGGPAGGSLAIDGCLAAVASASIVWFVWLHPEWMERPLWAGLFFAGMAVLCAVLVIRAPWFGLFAWSGYLFSGSVLHGRSRIAGLGATALLLGTSQSGGLPAGSTSSWFGWGAIVAVNMLLASAMVWIGTMDELQEHRKERRSKMPPIPISGCGQRSRRTRASTVSWSSRRGRRGSSTSASGWLVRSTTRWRRG